MKNLVAAVALVSVLALVGCAQGQDSSPANGLSESVGSSESAGSAEAPAATGSSSAAGAPATAEGSDAEEAGTQFVVGVGDVRFMVEPADTDAARALMEQLQAGPVTVSLHAYGGFEQVGPLPWSLPARDEQITTSPGDIMLYQGDQITIFTGPNSWAYTPLGRIEGATSETLLEVLGGDAAEITLALP